ncbi:type IV pilus biogenesis/stability protein PilW [Ideonella sp. DXS29W]|uniref:Type IV pilus biogenesis/stability protein PilW n=1 Tax=Ideonella lacteola TaxID=2984193 RepID=A0ABU9BX12_9BURK
MASLGLLAALGLLSGCTTTGAGAGASVAKTPGEVQTESDTTDVERRARVRMELAVAYFGRGQWNTALDEVKLALQAQPDFADAYNLRGLIYASMGEPALAEESFRRALQLNPRDADTMHNFGWFLCQNRRYADAEAQFNAALATPNYREAVRTYMAMGACQARNNQLEQAERSLQKSYELDPANPTTALNLAEVLYRRGDFERARFYVRRVNAVEQFVSAQTLWLAVRIENKLGQDAQVKNLGTQLSNRFPQSSEALRYEKGRFDE